VARVSVMLVTPEPMEERVLSVLSTITKQDWGLLLALRVKLTRSPSLVVSQTQTVSVTLGIRGQTGARARCVRRAHTKTP